jgi:hypothetical protein
MKLFRVAVLATFLVSASARQAKAELGFGAHAAYFLGPGARDPVFRNGGDFFVGVTSMETKGSSTGMWSSGHGEMIGMSALVGIGETPTYLIPEVATVEHTTLAGLAGAAGLVARTDQKGYGVSLRISGDILLLQLGVRLVLVAAPTTDAQLSVTLGLGRF